MKKCLIIALFFLVSTTCLATTGDILYRNCSETGGTCTGADPAVTYLTRSVETSGCQSGSCLKLVGSANGSTGIASHGGSSGLSIAASGISGEDEITVVYYTKFSPSGEIENENMKSIRPYVGGSSYYFGATITKHFGYAFYISYNNGTTRPESGFTCRDNGYSDTYMTDNDDGTFNSSTGKIAGMFDIGGQDGFGAYWTKVRHWIKLPSTTTSTDGEMKMWINGELAFHSYDLSMLSGTPQATFSGLTFYPSSEASEEFEQWLDEMIVYEGYVPPVSSTANIKGVTIN